MVPPASMPITMGLVSDLVSRSPSDLAENDRRLDSRAGSRHMPKDTMTARRRSPRKGHAHGQYLGAAGQGDRRHRHGQACRLPDRPDRRRHRARPGHRDPLFGDADAGIRQAPALLGRDGPALSRQLLRLRSVLCLVAARAPARHRAAEAAGRRGGQARPVHRRASWRSRRSATRSASCSRTAATGASASSSTARRSRSRTARSRCWTSGCRCSRPCMRSTSRRAAAEFSRTSAPTGPGASPQQEPTIPASLWPELSPARARAGAADPGRTSRPPPSPSGSASPSAR